MGCEVCKPEHPCTQFSRQPDVDPALPAAPELQARPNRSEPLSPPNAAGKLSSGQAVAGSQTLKFLSKVKLFKRLPPDQLPILAVTCTEVAYESGQVIIRQGEAGNEFFVIRNGEASVTINGKKVATLRSSDHFGEGALLHDEPRNATITASTALAALKITRHDFQTLGLHKKLNFPNRKAVGGHNAGAGPAGAGPAAKSAGSPKTLPEQRLIESAIKSNKHLQSAVSLDDQTVRCMVDAAQKRAVPVGTKVITEGSLDADFFYVVQEGSFEVLIPGSGEHSPKGGGAEGNARALEVAAVVEKGGSFGELALLYVAPRAATVVCKEEAVVWTVDRADFKRALALRTDEVFLDNMKYIEKVAVLSHLSGEQKQAVARALVEMSFNSGETIVEQGEVGDTFYILVEGEVQVLKDGAEQTRMTSTSDSIHIFGERALLTAEPRAATVKVLSATARALAMDRDSFDMLLGQIEELRKLNAGGQPRAATKTQGIVRRSDLSTAGLLGCGGFGMVELVEHKRTGATYALKSLSKGYVVKIGMQNAVMNEKEIQLMCDSPFIVKLYETYNDPQALLLLLELALGGDLYGTYNRHSFHGSEPHAKFYTAGVILAFEHMHKKKIIYRDLKPENLLLTGKGHIKLTDMGLAKVLVGRTFTTCGTPDYFAPEVIASKGYNHSVDWWALGVLLYELMVGQAPFTAPSPMQIFDKVSKGINKVHFPTSCVGDIEDLTKSLCKKDPSLRLPMKKGGVGTLKKHNWFSNFAWPAMERLEMSPPYVPPIKSKTDISNFTASKEDLPPQIPYKDDGSGWDKGFATSQ